jgi:hypothetical protein
MFKVFIMIVALISGTAFSQHRFFSNHKDSTRVFFSETGQAEYATSPNQKWIGGGLNTETGIEFGRFLQINIGHTMVNIQNLNDASRNLRGFRLTTGIKLIFSSPVVNMELGGGLLGSKYDYQNDANLASFIGYGNYATLGFNYFLSRNISMLTQFTKVNDSLKRETGCDDIHRLKFESSIFNWGFRFNF